MSLARAINRGARLNARFGVNGTQKEFKSLGTPAGGATFGRLSGVGMA
jgi:hypothetical protein